MTDVKLEQIELFNGEMELNLCWITGSLQETASWIFDRETEDFCDWYAEATGKDVDSDLMWDETEYDYLGMCKNIADDLVDIMSTDFDTLFSVHDSDESDAPCTSLQIDRDGVELSRDLFSGHDYVPATMTVDADALRVLLKSHGIESLDDGRTPGSGFYRTLDAPEWYVIAAIRALFDSGICTSSLDFPTPLHVFESDSYDFPGEFISFPESLSEEAHAAQNGVA